MKSLPWNAFRWLFILIVPVLLYAPTYDAEYIFDDGLFFTTDPVMTDPQGLARIWWNPTDNNGAWPYIPITRTTFWIEAQLTEFSPAVSHGINVLLHGVAAILLWQALVCFRVRYAWFLGLLFAVHPVYVQSVAWVAERKNGVSGLFYILALWSYVYFDQQREKRWYVAALLLFIAALLSKTSTIMFPVVAIFACVWLRPPWKPKDALWLIPFFGVALIAAYSRVWFEVNSFGAQGSLYTHGFLERLLIAGHIPFFYLSKFVVPFPLAFTYERWSIPQDTLASYVPLLSIGLVAAVLIWKYRTWGRSSFLALGAFLVALFPVLGFFNNSWTQYSFVSDHWVHLPSLSILIAVGIGLGDFVQKIAVRHGRQTMAGVLGGGVILTLGTLTWKQTHIYQDLEALWLDTVAKTPSSLLAHNNLGVIYASRQEYEKALHSFNIVIENRFGGLDAYNNRGILHFQMQQYDRAIADFTTAIQVNPAPQYWVNRGKAYLFLGQNETAYQDFSLAIQVDPQLPTAFYYRGLAAYELQNIPQAEQDLSRSLELQPDFRDAYNARGELYRNFQRLDLACRDWKQACQLGDCGYAQQHCR